MLGSAWVVWWRPGEGAAGVGPGDGARGAGGERGPGHVQGGGLELVALPGQKTEAEERGLRLRVGLEGFAVDLGGLEEVALGVVGGVERRWGGG
jgi:hypothetical protein